jgi:hypothetical protein
MAQMKLFSIRLLIYLKERRRNDEELQLAGADHSHSRSSR